MHHTRSTTPMNHWQRCGLVLTIVLPAAAAIAWGSINSSPGNSPGVQRQSIVNQPRLTSDPTERQSPETQGQTIGAAPHCGDEVFSQVIINDVISAGTIQCGDASAPYTSANGVARSFEIPDGEALTVQCVRFGIESNSDIPWDVDVNIYTGDIEGPFDQLELLASSQVTVPANVTNEFYSAAFPDGVEVPGGSSMVVELFVASRNPADGGPGGFTYLASNSFGETAPSYLRAPACGLNDFETYEQIGFPGVHLIIDVYGGTPQTCVGDLNLDGAVNVFDLLDLLGQWGPCPPDQDCSADMNGDGAVNVMDLLILLDAWGPCPEPPVATGACCLEPEHCQELTATECADADGFYGGDGVPCDAWQACGLPGECAGNCFGQAPSGCYCDDACTDFGDCCANICHDCPHHEYCSECWEHECPPGAIPEGEPCGADTNEGCNLVPHQYTPVSCGDTICGTVWAQGGARDTDWFELDLTGFDESVLITWSVKSSIPLNAFIIHHQCPPIVVSSDVGCQASTSYCFEPGIYTVFVAPVALNHYACDGAGPVPYVATIECQSGTGCIPPVATCAGHCGGSSPGGCWCDATCYSLGDCCEDVCDHCAGLHFCHDSGGSCAGACGGQGSASCFCDEDCAFFDDCCEDVCVQCQNLSHCP